jgi:hypothetical protein
MCRPSCGCFLPARSSQAACTTHHDRRPGGVPRRFWIHGLVNRYWISETASRHGRHKAIPRPIQARNARASGPVMVLVVLAQRKSGLWLSIANLIPELIRQRVKARQH